jgi:aminoglycoside 3-N-acetyltransferase
MHVIVHASLSSLGRVRGGASTVVESLLAAVGGSGTLVAPAFTPQVRDPFPDHRGAPDPGVQAHRDAVPVFTAELASPMGAIAEAVRTWPGALRSRHPQASVTAVGSRAAEIVSAQPLHFAVGPGSPFDRLHELGGHILPIGVGHNRNSCLHYAESRTARPRLKLRRFPMLVGDERIWCETTDVGDDNDTHFPVVGREYEHHADIEAVTVGAARTVLLPVRPFVTYARRRLTELVDEDTED